jgi:hypothetical protein
MIKKLKKAAMAQQRAVEPKRDRVYSILDHSWLNPRN